MSIGAPRRLSASSHSIDDYPEHLNPFFEEDNHNRIRFWTIGRKSFRERSNSFSMQGLKDLRSTWSFKSFMRKGRRDSVKPSAPPESATSSPITYRKPLGANESSYNGFNRNTVPGTPDRYVYGGSITPLPRSRFQERISHLEQRTLNVNDSRLQEGVVSDSPGNLSSAKANNINGSCISVQSESAFGASPVRASARKKRRAPPPPPPRTSTLTVDIKVHETSATTEHANSISNDSKHSDRLDILHADIDINDPSFNVELRIVEDDDIAHADSKEKDLRPQDLPNERITVDRKEMDICLQDSPDERTTETSNDQEVCSVRETNGKVNLPIPDIIPDEKYGSEIDKDKNKVNINSENLFPKVNINSYKRQNSIPIIKSMENMDVSPTPKMNNTSDKTDSLKTGHTDISKNTNNVHNNNVEKNDLISSSPNQDKLQKIDTTVKDFLDIDKATQELEVEIRRLNQEMETMYENEPYKRKTVTDIKLIFDGSNDPNTPNPIPKPRRTRVSNSPESNQASPTQESKNDLIA